MIARVPHLVTVEEVDGRRGRREDPRSEAGRRARTDAASASAAASAARAARPPAAAPRARRARDTVPVGFEGGQLPLAHAGPEAARASTTRSGSSTRRVNLDALEATGLDEVDPEIAARARASSHKGALVKVLGRGELTRAVTVKAHALLEVGRGRHHRRRRHGRGPAAAVGRPPPAGQGQPPHQPLTGSTSGRPEPHEEPARCSPACRTSSRSRTSGTRSCSRSLMIALYRLGAHLPVPGIDFGALKQLQDQRRDRAASSASSQLFSGGALTNVRDLRPRDHAVHHGVDHHADPRRGDPQARAVAEAGRGRPAEDHPVDPLRHHRHRAPAVDRPGRSCSTTAAAGFRGGNSTGLDLMPELQRRPRAAHRAHPGPPAPRC